MIHSAAGGHSGLLADMYQLSMAQGYWLTSASDMEASFYVSFRENPFGGGFTLFCGLEQVLDHLERLRFSDSDIEHLAGMRGSDGMPLFDAGCLKRFREFRFKGDVDAVAEGTVVFPGEPVLKVTGPIADCQLVESATLNTLNFQSLVATKASRVCLAAGKDPVVEFGLRRAQGPDGALSASRAAYVGGCVATSNTLASRLFGIPAAGTHAHSWVVAFDEEEEAFEAFARTMPGNCTFLVDTYDTLRGVRRAVDVAKRMRLRGHEMAGIRIDSGDLAYFSVEARKILDEGGFPSAKIVASNELDEHVITSLKNQGAAVDIWGVGTKLVTAFDQPAISGVYKLSAVRRKGGEWVPRIKISEQTAKVTIPGILGVRRYFSEDGIAGDMVYDLHAPPSAEACMIDPLDVTRRKCFDAKQGYTEILRPVLRGGVRTKPQEPLESIRSRAISEIDALDPAIKRFLNPQGYPVGLESSLYERRKDLIMLHRNDPDQKR